jgi:outer membrane protein
VKNYLKNTQGVFIGFALAGIFMFAGAFVAGESQKIGYVESDKIFEQMPESKQVEAKLKAKAEGWNAEFEKMKKDLSDAKADYDLKEGTMSAATKDQKQKDLQAKFQKLQEYQQQKLGQGGELEQEQVRLLKPIEERVIAAIEQTAKAEGIAIVLNKGKVANSVVYANKQLDLTFKVLDRLNRGGSK